MIKLLNENDRFEKWKAKIKLFFFQKKLMQTFALFLEIMNRKNNRQVVVP